MTVIIKLTCQVRDLEKGSVDLLDCPVAGIVIPAPCCRNDFANRAKPAKAGSDQDYHEPWTREVWGLPLFPSLLSRPRWSRFFSRFVPLRSSWSFGFRVGLWFDL